MSTTKAQRPTANRLRKLPGGLRGSEALADSNFASLQDPRPPGSLRSRFAVDRRKETFRKNAMNRTRTYSTLVVLFLTSIIAAAEPTVREVKDGIEIETDQLSAKINAKGYVSGIAAGTFVDKKTGAREIGFGLHIMDFLLAPGWRDDGYPREQKLHGNLPKHYVEGPQICTQAKELKPEVIRGKDFVAVKVKFTYTQPGKGYKAGSTWEQTLVFQPGVRYFLSCEKITSANDVDDLFYRVDMPGHVKHKDGDTFANVYLSYVGKPIPAAEFKDNFGPDDKFLYQRGDKKIPERMIRAYQVKVAGKPGPWMAGMTLDPAETAEAWCHQRGYICFIEELHKRKVQAGETFGAAYVVGWFDDVAEMEKVYDKYKGAKTVEVKDGKLTVK
jgi:hypothetical protein